MGEGQLYFTFFDLAINIGEDLSREVSRLILALIVGWLSISSVSEPWNMKQVKIKFKLNFFNLGWFSTSFVS